MAGIGLIHLSATAGGSWSIMGGMYVIGIVLRGLLYSRLGGREIRSLSREV